MFQNNKRFQEARSRQSTKEYDAVPLWKIKLTAFATHLGISLIIFLGLLYFIVFEWYPPPFFSTDGGWQGIRIIAMVGLVIGPLLTLIVFKPGKKGLKFDLSLIAAAQLGTLAWGIWTVYNERPVAVVFAEDSFSPVPVYLMAQHGIHRKDLERFGDETPVPIYSNLPLDDSDKIQALRAKAIQTATPLFLFAEYYQPINEHNTALINRHALDMPLYLEVRPKVKPAFETFKREHRQQLPRLNFFALHGRFERRIIAVNKDTMDFVATVPIEPPDPTEEAKMQWIKKQRHQGATVDRQSGK
jgi:hypothetical protein